MSATRFARTLLGYCLGACVLPAAFARADAPSLPTLPQLPDADPFLLAARDEFLGIPVPAALGDVLVVLERLPPASGLLLVLVVLLLLSWLVQRRMTAARVAKRARDVKQRSSRGSGLVPSYPKGDVTNFSASVSERSIAKSASGPAPAAEPDEDDERADTEVLVIKPKAAAEEEDFTALYRQAVSAPKAPASATPEAPEKEAGRVWIEEESASSPSGVEIDIVEDDALFSFADDEASSSTEAEVVAEDDPLFTLVGDEPEAADADVDVDDAAGLFVLEGDEQEAEVEEEVLLVVVDDEQMTIEPAVDGASAKEIEAAGAGTEPLVLVDDESGSLEAEGDDAGFDLAGDEDEPLALLGDEDEPLALLGDEEAAASAPTEADDEPLTLLGDDEDLEPAPQESDDEPLGLLGAEDALPTALTEVEDEEPLVLLGDEGERAPAPTEVDEEPLLLLGEEEVGTSASSEAEDAPLVLEGESDHVASTSPEAAEAPLVPEADTAVETEAPVADLDDLHLAEADEAEAPADEEPEDAGLLLAGEEPAAAAPIDADAPAEAAGSDAALDPDFDLELDDDELESLLDDVQERDAAPAQESAAEPDEADEVDGAEPPPAADGEAAPVAEEVADDALPEAGFHPLPGGAEAATAEALPPGILQIRPRRGREQQPTLVIVEGGEPALTSEPAALAEAALALLAGDDAPQRVAFRIAPDQVRDETADEIAEHFRAAGQDPARLCVFVDAALAEAEVARVRGFGRKLGLAGVGLGLCAAEPRNRVPVMVRMTSSMLVRFDPDAIDALIATDEGILELARITNVVRERGAEVLLATADPEGRQQLLAGQAAGLRWEYLEAPPAG